MDPVIPAKNRTSLRRDFPYFQNTVVRATEYLFYTLLVQPILGTGQRRHKGEDHLFFLVDCPRSSARTRFLPGKQLRRMLVIALHAAALFHHLASRDNVLIYRSAIPKPVRREPRSRKRSANHNDGF
jgi:cytochrome b561